MPPSPPARSAALTCPAQNPAAAVHPCQRRAACMPCADEGWGGISRHLPHHGGEPLVDTPRCRHCRAAAAGLNASDTGAGAACRRSRPVVPFQTGCTVPDRSRPFQTVPDRSRPVVPFRTGCTVPDHSGPVVPFQTGLSQPRRQIYYRTCWVFGIYFVRGRSAAAARFTSRPAAQARRHTPSRSGGMGCDGRSARRHTPSQLGSRPTGPNRSLPTLSSSLGGQCKRQCNSVIPVPEPARGAQQPLFTPLTITMSVQTGTSAGFQGVAWTHDRSRWTGAAATTCQLPVAPVATRTQPRKLELRQVRVAEAHLRAHGLL